MNQVFDRFFSNKSLLIIFVLVLFSFLSTLWNRSIYIDDAWFGEQAYWFAQEGIAKTETIKDYFWWDEHLLVYHKLNILIGALIVKAFGWSVDNFRFFTLLTLAIFVAIFIRYLRFHESLYGRKTIIIAVFFLCVNPLIILLGYTYRPEILVMALGFMSWIFLEKSWKNKPPVYNSFFSGLFAGLAFFTHLNGIIFPLAGGFLLLFRKDYRQLILFSSGTLITASLFFYDLWQPGRWELFIYQMQNWPDHVGGNYLSGNTLRILTNALLKLSQEHQRFFWSDKVWVLSASFFLSLILSFRTLITHHKNLFVYSISLIISHNLFGSHIAERYILYYLPFMAIIIAIGITETSKKKIAWPKAIFVIFLVTQLIFCSKMVYTIIADNKNYVDMHQRILSKVPEPQSLTLVDYPFVFNGLKTNNLMSFKTFEYKEVTQKAKFDRRSLLAEAHRLGVKYVIVALEKSIIENNNFYKLFEDKNASYYPYEIYYESDGYIILRLTQPAANQ